MQIYLVGGAIRDHHLNLPVVVRDWVVVGATPEAMVAQGFLPIGKEFPVFLHPETHEEYALARTERKVARGYKGFVFYADPSVTLEQDLARRDLTINAIAQSQTGELIDPFGGLQDLQKKILRHVSPAFEEDPVRILRVARLASKFTDFTIDPSTTTLMREMVTKGEVDALVPERVWKEWQRALQNPKPERFFTVLESCGALAVLFPALKRQGRGLSCLAQSRLTDPVLRFAISVHDLSTDALKQLIQRYRIPNDYAELALLTQTQLTPFANATPTQASDLLALLLQSDALRRPERFFNFLALAEEILGQNATPKAALLREALKKISAVDTKPLQQKNLPGPAFAAALHELRLNTLTHWLKSKDT